MSLPRHSLHPSQQFRAKIPENDDSPECAEYVCHRIADRDNRNLLIFYFLTDR